jgi:hypothetical protein
MTEPGLEMASLSRVVVKIDRYEESLGLLTCVYGVSLSSEDATYGLPALRRLRVPHIPQPPTTPVGQIAYRPRSPEHAGAAGPGRCQDRGRRHTHSHLADRTPIKGPRE